MDYTANNASGAFVNCRTLKSVWKLWYRFTFPHYISAQCLCIHTTQLQITLYLYILYIKIKVY